jgi:hypothetical protein
MLEARARDEGEQDAGDALAGPHDAVCQSFAMHEPLIEVEGCGREEQATAKTAYDALRSNELRDGGCEGGHEEANGRDDQPNGADPSSEARPS